MGNIGRPSTGCGLCRQRRVKCDEGRPGCRNCARLKKPCPGYREPDYGLVRTVFFGSEADHPAQRSSSTEGLPPAAASRARSSSTEIEETNSVQSDSVLELSHRPQHQILGSLPSDITEHAVWYSLTQLEVNSRVLYGNDNYNFLPHILRAAGPESYLYAAMRSVAAINLANRSPTVDMRSVVDSEYAKAVSGVTAALADPEQYLKDETLVAVWLLGMRELLASVTRPSRVNAHGVSLYQTHIDGTLMLLRLRGEDQFQRPEGRHLYQLLLSSMHWRSLFLSEEPTQEYLVLESQISKATDCVPNASLKLRTFFHGISKLRARIKNFLHIGQDSSLDRPQIVQTYFKAAARLEEKVAGWCDVPEWLPRPVRTEPPHPEHSRTPWTSGSLFRLHCFQSWTAFFHWNRYSVAKICLHAALLDALASLAAHPSTDSSGDESARLSALISRHTVAIHNTVAEFIGTISYAFGDVDDEGLPRPAPTVVVADGASSECRGIDVPATFQIHPPLAFLINLKYLGPGQREAMFVALQRVRAEFCLR